MTTAAHLAKHVRDVHFGGNWTSVNFRDTLNGVTWQQATTQVHAFNSIATLLYHTNYYIAAVLKVFQGGALEAKDIYSFGHPPIHSQQDWQALQDKAWADAEQFATLIEQLPEDRLWQDFTHEKYGNYYRNIQGIIEHTHYHLGQVVLIKKLVTK